MENEYEGKRNVVRFGVGHGCKNAIYYNTLGVPAMLVLKTIGMSHGKPGPAYKRKTNTF